jgi:transcription elongation factor Elf1
MEEKTKKWFKCPICGFEHNCKTDDKCKGGVFVKCKKCGNEVEVVHQK